MLSLAENLVLAVELLAIALYYLEGGWYYAAVLTATFLFYAGDATWHHRYLAAGISLANVAVWAFITWLEWKNRKRKKRRRLLSKLGYKGRAALAKLVRGMPKPRAPRVRVPAPSPG